MGIAMEVEGAEPVECEGVGAKTELVKGVPLAVFELDKLGLS